MSHPPRRPPPLGLRRTDRTRPVVRLGLTGAVPEHPAAADHLAQVAQWNGETNLAFGTCGPCSVANHAIITWRYLAGLDITVSDAAIFDLYRRSGNPDFDPATGYGDGGVDMTVMLAELVKGGIEITGPDGGRETVRPYCFAAAAAAHDDMEAITAIFGAADLAVDLDVAQQSQTDAGVWDYAPSSPWGGHAITGGKYSGASGAGQPDEVVISWMEPIGMTDQFVAHQLTDLYVIVWPLLWDHPAFVAGVDRAALAADYEALTGRPFPAPAPVPPPPAPAPEPPGCLPSWLRR